MKKKGYLAVPRELILDRLNGKIKSFDLELWMIFQDLGFHGDWFFVSESDIHKISKAGRTKISTAIKSLLDSGHIDREKFERGFKTKLLTRVEVGKIFIKGELKN